MASHYPSVDNHALFNARLSPSFTDFRSDSKRPEVELAVRWHRLVEVVLPFGMPIPLVFCGQSSSICARLPVITFLSSDRFRPEAFLTSRVMCNRKVTSTIDLPMQILHRWHVELSWLSRSVQKSFVFRFNCKITFLVRIQG